MQKATPATAGKGAPPRGGPPAAGGAGKEDAAAIHLLTEDGECVRVAPAVAAQMGTIGPLLALGGTFPLPSVRSTTLAKVIEYLAHHGEAADRHASEEGEAEEAAPPQRPRAVLLQTAGQGGGRAGAARDSATEEDDDEEELEQVRRLVSGRPVRDKGAKAPLHHRRCDDDDDDEDEDESEEEEYDAATSPTALLTPWEGAFFEGLSLGSLIEVTKAANYLNAPQLLEACCRSIARQMVGLRADELRAKFNLPDDLTAEEKGRMATEFAWIDE